MSNTSGDIYNGLAVYGRVNAIIGSVVAGIVVVILIVVGTKMWFTKDRQTRHAEGKVMDMVNSQYSVQYTVDGKLYMINGSGKNVVNGQTVDVLYDPSNPYSARVSSQISKHSLGGILLLTGMVVGIITGTSLYFTLKYKDYAAAQGGFSAARQIRSII
jgi:hypothetical protein